MAVTAPKAWNPVWDEVFTARSWGRYPSEELVAFVGRTFGALPDHGAIRLLDLGCGPGGNVWFLVREGYRVSGIDGSKIAIARAQDRLKAEGLQADVRVGDLVDLPFEDGLFHGVFDIAAIQHNLQPHRARIASEARRVLAPGGKLFMTLIGSGSWGEGTGTELEPGTFTDVTEGPATGCGAIHFFREDELPALVEGFREMTYERKEHTWQGRSKKVVQWVVTALK